MFAPVLRPAVGLGSSKEIDEAWGNQLRKLA